MTDVFLFGTLCWPELLRLVGGASCPVGVDAELPGYHVGWAKGQAFPAIHPKAGCRARGILLRGCDAQVLARMDHYESGFGYRLHPVTVTAAGLQVEAQVYLPPDGLTPGPEWSLTDWQEAHGALALEASSGGYGRDGADGTGRTGTGLSDDARAGGCTAQGAVRPGAVVALGPEPHRCRGA